MFDNIRKFMVKWIAGFADEVVDEMDIAENEAAVKAYNEYIEENGPPPPDGVILQKGKYVAPLEEPDFGDPDFQSDNA